MKRVQFGPEPLGRRARRIVRYVRIPLCRGWIGVSEEAPDDLKAEAARNEVGSLGVPIVVQTIARKARLRGDRLPELRDVLEGLEGLRLVTADPACARCEVTILPAA